MSALPPVIFPPNQQAIEAMQRFEEITEAVQRTELGPNNVPLTGTSGIELGQKLAAEGDHAPVIYITGQADFVDARAQGERVHCAAFFRKTDSTVGVMKAIRRILEEGGVTTADEPAN